MTEPELGHRRRPRSEGVLILAAVVACLPILAISLFAALARTDDIDAFLYAYYAKRMLAGQRLYADLWDNKPPGIFWTGVVGLFLAGGRYVGIVVMCSLATVGSCIAFFVTARRLYGTPAAAIGVVMAALYLYIYDYHVGNNRPSTFYVFFELCVMALYVHSFDGQGSRRRLLFWAGVCAVGAASFRQVAFSSAAAMAVHQLWLLAAGRQSRSLVVSNAAAFIKGCAAAALLVAALLWWTSDLSFAWHAIVSSNMGYFMRPGKSEFLPELYRWEDHVQWFGLPLILATAAVIHAVGSRRFFAALRMTGGPKMTETLTRARSGGRPGAPGSPVDGRPPARFALVAAWFPIALYLALVGPSKRMMYFGVALAPLVMLATHGVWLLVRREDGRGRPRITVIVGVLWFAFMMLPAVLHQLNSAGMAYFRRFDDRASSRHEFIVDAVRRHTSPADPIYMWGYLPTVYWYADRPLAQRYIVTTLIDQWPTRAQPYVDNVIFELMGAPPKAIILNRGELETIENPPADHPIHYGDFGPWLREHYFVPDDCRGANVWIRND